MGRFYTLSLEKVRGQLPAPATSLPWELLGGWWIGLRVLWRGRILLFLGVKPHASSILTHFLESVSVSNLYISITQQTYLSASVWLVINQGRHSTNHLNLFVNILSPLSTLTLIFGSQMGLELTSVLVQVFRDQGITRGEIFLWVASLHFLAAVIATLRCTELLLSKNVMRRRIIYLLWQQGSNSSAR